MAKEFLGESGIAFEAWNVARGEGVEEWVAAGRPSVPAIMIGSHVETLVVPPVQIASLLGLSMPKKIDDASLIWDIMSLHTSWLSLAKSVSLVTLEQPTPSRGRTSLELLANVFYGLEQTVQAWETGKYEWGIGGPLLEAAEATILSSFENRESVVGYLEECSSAWNVLALELGDGSADLRRIIAGPLGESFAFRDILANQRQHAALHLRQVTYVLDNAGVDHSAHSAFEGMKSLVLPAYPF